MKKYVKESTGIQLLVKKHKKIFVIAQYLGAIPHGFPPTRE